MEKHGQLEVEVKVPVREPGRIKQVILEAGGKLVRERHFESNFLYDYSDRSLSASGCLLRIRELPEGALLTFKGKVIPHDKYKARPEAETICQDVAAIRSILHSLGFRPFFRYQKYREEHLLSETHVCIDELPFGFYLEIEGEPDGINETVERLGLDKDSFSRRSYASLYAEICREQGVPFGDILFKTENGTKG